MARSSTAKIDPELEMLFKALPPRLAAKLRKLPDVNNLIEVVMDLGREPEARFLDGGVILSTKVVTENDLEYTASRVGEFGDDNRAGIERTLHRISAIRNRNGKLIGLTCRVGRAVTGTVDIIKDIVVSGQSILLLGKPGIGKTTMLRECARVLADEMKKRVVIVDTSNEIGGDGDIPHPGIGRARRMQVKTPSLQHAVMIEAVENHMPEVIVIDEIGTELEAAAARTIAERGVQLIATAHGITLENLLVDPVLNDLLGGIQSVTLSDDEARRRGTQKSVLERKAPPTFDVLVEIQARDRVAIHKPLAEVVDAALRHSTPPPIIRVRTKNGGIISTASESSNGELTHKIEIPKQSKKVQKLASGQGPIGIFPYGISRSYLEQSLRELNINAKVRNNLDQAELMLTLKNYYRRKPDSVRQAELNGIPIHVLKSNTVSQIKQALRAIYGTQEEE